MELILKNFWINANDKLPIEGKLALKYKQLKDNLDMPLVIDYFYKNGDVSITYPDQARTDLKLSEIFWFDDSSDKSDKIDYHRLHIKYSNLEYRDGRLEGEVKYVLRSDRGDEGTIIFINSTDIRIFIDNYPGQKKYYSFNLPLLTYKELEYLLNKCGFKLIEY